MTNISPRGRPDFILLILTILLVGIGLVMVFSSSFTMATYKHQNALFYIFKQGWFAAAGLFLMLFMMGVPFKRWKNIAPILLLLSLILLILVLIVGVSINGAKRWIMLGGVSLQPSEWTKLSLILYLAALISNKGERIRDFKKGLLPILVVSGLILVLVMLQPDFGTMSILCIITLACIIVGGANLRHVLWIGLGVLPILAYMAISKSYRIQRLTSFLNPLVDPTDSGYQVVQSLTALGHGGFTGTGLGGSVQKLLYLPEAHTDFIFAIIGEEFGFIGSFLFINLFFGLLSRGFLIAIKSQDLFGLITGMGIVTMIFVQFALNVGAAVGILPVTGVPLPFISYGGSALLTNMAAVGLLLSISRENNRLRAERKNRKSLKKRTQLTLIK
ncbi:putative lipid II flippase FtsW [Paenibacillus bouchesdurhonensis]|uniref:putative lipid II flippase FtsW n=1 Tax=Paenibacillus bouchesdurhonensis TaxID=1870990 RepID=UPI00190171B0|nr:putative lipid II flippase FtsW [Paenibacillus bouchesdurhonensis]